MSSYKLSTLILPNTVIFPNTAASLEIEGKTAVRAIRASVENEGHIFMAMPIHPERSSLPQEIGCIARIEIIQEFSQDHVEVLITGLERAKVKKITQELPYPQALVILIPDISPETPVCFGNKIEKLQETFEQWLEYCIDDSHIRESLKQEVRPLTHLVHYISLLLIRDSQMRQSLLENRNLNERIQALDLLLCRHNSFHEDPKVLEAFRDFENTMIKNMAFH